MKTTVGVFFGCMSVEHEVAIISAQQVMGQLDKNKYDIVPIYIAKDGTWYTGDARFSIDNFKNMNTLYSKCQKIVISPNAGDGTIFLYPEGLFSKKPIAKIDVAFPVMHGTYGEDGCLQGLLELIDLPYVGPSPLSGGICMDKVGQKALCKMGDIPVLDCVWFYSGEWGIDEDNIIAKVEQSLSYPVIVKPADLGSSIGIKKAANSAELKEAIELACQFTQRVLVEPAITELREINCAVLGDSDGIVVSCLEEPMSSDEILSFGDKYLRSNGQKGMSGLKRKIPADVEEGLKNEIESIAKDAFYHLYGTGVWRLDFMVDKAINKVYLNEINTIPGSLSFYLWEPLGKSFSELLDDLIRLSINRHRKKKNTVSTYDSNILAQGGFKGKK